MPATRPKLILIQCGPQQSSVNALKKLIRIERYLARQAKSAHNLGIHNLEIYYLVGYLALKLWRVELVGEDPQPKGCSRP